MNKPFRRAALALALGWASVTAQAMPNLVANPSFEDGFDGWTTGGDIFLSDETARMGNYSAETGCTGLECVSTPGEGSFIGQAVATSPGGVYSLSFWVKENGGPPAALSVFWNGSLVAAIDDPAPVGEDFLNYTFDNLDATGAATAFEIHGRQDNAFMFFDDVSVVQTGGPTVPMPEPASLALLGLGLAGVGGVRRRLGRKLA